MKQGSLVAFQITPPLSTMFFVKLFSSFVFPVPKVRILSSWPPSLLEVLFLQKLCFPLASQLKPFRMNRDDPLLQIIDSTLTLTTREVLRDITIVASNSNDFERVLNRFIIQSITLCKDTTQMPNHEILTLKLFDTHTDADTVPSRRTYVLVLERTPSTAKSDNPPPSGGFVKTLKGMKTTFSGSLSRSKERLGYQAIGDADPSSTASDSESLQLPFVDAATLAFTGAARASTQSISPIYVANDTFRGGEKRGVVCHNHS
jgi:hypothetical protein